MTVEAPAGCGKTFQAAEAAIDLAVGLRPGQEVLLLAHTHAAVQEFRRRVKGRRARVRAMTLDGFALELVSAFASSLSLPNPIRVDGTEGIPFEVLAPRLVELFGRAPSVANAVAGHYPVILFDEHQDARRDQHEIAVKLESSNRTRLRFFGDPMQAIYGFGGDLVEWSEVVRTSGCFERLDEPHRWSGRPELGRWIMAARVALESGNPLPADNTPQEVTIRVLSDVEEAPPPRSRNVAPGITGPLCRILDRTSGSVGILARYNDNVVGLRRATARRVLVQEGAELDLAYTTLGNAVEAAGDPRHLARLVIEFLSKTCAGCDSSFRAQIDRCLGVEEIDMRRQKKFRPFLELLQQLYHQPGLATWCEVIRQVLLAPPQGIKIDLPEALRVVGNLQPVEGEDVRALLDRAVQMRRQAGFVPLRCASTVHKAKGQEFDHIVIAHCSAASFPDSFEGRRLLYVALSRAKESLTILAPSRDPSPLLGTTS